MPESKLRDLIEVAGGYNEVACRSKVDRATLYNLVAGRTLNPGLEVSRAVAGVLGISLDAFAKILPRQDPPR